jgi:hypothetical protein
MRVSSNTRALVRWSRCITPAARAIVKHAPCAAHETCVSDGCEQMLSMDVEAGRSDNGRFAKNLILNRFWVKKIDAPQEVFGIDVFDDSAMILIRNETNWTGGADTGPLLDRQDAPAKCVHCVTRRAMVELQITQPTFDYFCAPPGMERTQRPTLLAAAFGH